MQFIKQYPKRLSDEACKRFVQLFEENSEHQVAGMSGLEYSAVSPEDKDTTDLDLRAGIDISGWNRELVEELNSHMFAVLGEYLADTYPSSKGQVRRWSEEAIRRRFFMTQPPRMMRYYPGQGFHAWHCDRNSENGRDIVVMIYLNDVFEGGETAFFHQGIKIKPEKGKLAVFPAAFTHHHRGEPVVSNTKYCINLNIGSR